MCQDTIFPQWEKFLYFTEVYMYMIKCFILGQGVSSQGSSRPHVQHQRPWQVQTSLTPCPFKKWSLYFPDSGKLHSFVITEGRVVDKKMKCSRF